MVWACTQVEPGNALGGHCDFFYAGGGVGVLPQHVHGTELTSIQRIELLQEQGTKRERAMKTWNEAV